MKLWGMRVRTLAMASAVALATYAAAGQALAWRLVEQGPLVAQLFVTNLDAQETALAVRCDPEIAAQDPRWSPFMITISRFSPELDNLGTGNTLVLAPRAGDDQGAGVPAPLQMFAYTTVADGFLVSRAFVSKDAEETLREILQSYAGSLDVTMTGQLVEDADISAFSLDFPRVSSRRVRDFLSACG